MTRVM